MNKITQAPHIAFWIIIPILLLIPFLNFDKTFEINIHDTYYVFDIIYIAIILSIFSGFIGLGYWVIFKIKMQLINWLTLVHVIVTISGFLAIMIINLFTPELIQDDSSSNFASFLGFRTISFYTISILIYTQLFYLFNIIISLFKKSI
ncbi:hypothetical protein [Maribacter sp. R86514]|uniref:hypothetical protein n=1 Tax=Maribacter sp. R86514 TaxID=3093854 RepID=UPI0037C6304E